MFIVALTYIGGVLVLFVYICSLSSNIKIESDYTYLLVVFFSVFYLLRKIRGFLSSRKLGVGHLLISRFYSKFDLGRAIIVAFYLTLGLLVRIHLVDKFSGPLKQLF